MTDASTLWLHVGDCMFDYCLKRNMHKVVGPGFCPNGVQQIKKDSIDLLIYLA